MAAIANAVMAYEVFLEFEKSEPLAKIIETSGGELATSFMGIYWRKGSFLRLKLVM